MASGGRRAPMSHFGQIAMQPVVRTYEEEKAFLKQVAPCEWRINQGFVQNMNVPGVRAA